MTLGCLWRLQPDQLCPASGVPLAPLLSRDTNSLTLLQLSQAGPSSWISPQHSPKVQRLLRNSLALNPSFHKTQQGSVPTSPRGTRQGWAEPTYHGRGAGAHEHPNSLTRHQGRGMPAQKMTYFASLHYFIGAVKLWHKRMMNSVFTFMELLCWLFGDEVLLGVIQPFKNYVSTQQQTALHQDCI